MMNCITSIKLLKDLPFRDGGGFDCNPTFATMSGWVVTVAKDFEMAPKTEGQVSARYCSRLMNTHGKLPMVVS